MLRYGLLLALLASLCTGYKITGTPKGQRCVTIQECPYLVNLVENGSQVRATYTGVIDSFVELKALVIVALGPMKGPML